MTGALGSIVLAAAFAGCRSESLRYAARTSWPQKDVVMVTVYLDRKLDVPGYLTIADREARKLLSTPAPSAVPIYEVRFDFFLPDDSPPARRKVARIDFHPETGGSAPFSAPPQIIIY